MNPSTFFVANVECADGSGAGITKTVLIVMEDFGVSPAQIMGFGTDGASVMTGHKKGASGMMRRQGMNPHLLNVHCIAHRLALCTSQAANNIPGMQEFHNTITSLFYYFRHATARTARFREIQNIVDNKELAIKEVHGVRWLSFYEALEVVFRTLHSLLTFLDEVKENDPKAAGLLKKIGTTKFISLAYLMMDIIPVVTKLSQFFQKQDLDVSQVEMQVSQAIRQLQMLKTRGEGVQGHYHQQLEQDLVGNLFKDCEVTGCHPDHITGTVRNFLDKLISNIQNRFPEDDTNLLTAFSALAMRPISLLSEEDRAEWGNGKLEVLLSHFGSDKVHTWPKEGLLPAGSKKSPPVVDPEQCREEWKLAKTMVVQQEYPKSSLAGLWGLMAVHHKNMFPNLLKLAELAITCPAHTADCERGSTLRTGSTLISGTD